MGFRLHLAVFIPELFSTKDKNSDNWPQISAPPQQMKSALKAVRFRVCTPKSAAFLYFLNWFIWGLWFVSKHFHTVQHFWAFPPCALSKPQTRVSTTNTWRPSKTLFGCYSKHFAVTLLRLSCLEITCPETGRERCVLVHSWINQRHYHQRWSYGFVVVLIG